MKTVILFFILFLNSAFAQKTEFLDYPDKIQSVINYSDLLQISVCENRSAPTKRLHDGIFIDNPEFYKCIVDEQQSKKPLVIVEQMPTYVGGDTAKDIFIQQTMKYPVVAKENGIQGRVMLRFVVNVDGTLSDVTVLKGVDPSCDKEAVRIVKAMPKWNPGKQNGKKVQVYYTLPIVFRINDNKKIHDNKKIKRNEKNNYNKKRSSSYRSL